MKIDSLLFKCSHPKKVLTKSGDVIYASCGKCKACIVQKARQKALVCDENERIHKYTFFVTLTYAPEYIPRAHGFKSFTENGRPLISFYDVDTCEYLGNMCYSHRLYDSFVRKVNNPNGYIHYARISDAQKFCKRLRYYISNLLVSKNKKNEKISYYIVSEYGPLHFRPHFHFLFSFDSSFVAENFSSLVCKAWKFGRVDTSLSRGGCSSYVASYINSTSALPKILTLRAFRPKSCHSVRYALPVLEGEFKKVYKNEPDRFVRYVVREYNGVLSTSAPWRSFKSYLFPKCQGYSMLTKSERVKIYNGLTTLERIYGTNQLAVDYLRLIYADYNNGRVPERVARILFNLNPNGDGYDLPVPDILLQRIYQFFHYRKLMRLADLTSIQLVCNIDKFYSSMDYTNLIEQYQILNESETVFSPGEYEMFSKVYWNPNFLDDRFEEYTEVNGIMFENSFLVKMYKNSTFYAIVRTSCENAFSRSIKHKELNDLNNIFV